MPTELSSALPRRHRTAIRPYGQQESLYPSQFMMSFCCRGITFWASLSCMTGEPNFLKGSWRLSNYKPGGQWRACRFPQPLARPQNLPRACARLLLRQQISWDLSRLTLVKTILQFIFISFIDDSFRPSSFCKLPFMITFNQPSQTKPHGITDLATNPRAIPSPPSPGELRSCDHLCMHKPRCTRCIYICI